MVLDDAKRWCLDNLRDDDTDAILLVGSWGRGEGKDPMDVDIIIIKSHQIVAIDHKEYKADGFALDCWIHDKNSMLSELENNPTDANGITSLSQILSFLRDCQVWYETTPFIAEWKQKALNWKWDSNMKDLLTFSSDEPMISWAKTAYNENLLLLEAARKRVDIGLPISHRRKDYPEVSSPSDENKAKKSLELTEIAHQTVGFDIVWSELKDATKAVQTGKWGDVIDSVKDVLRYMIRYALPSVPDQLLDPSLWKSAEEMPISKEMMDALQEAFS